MADDRVGADSEGVGILLDIAEIFAAQPLGGELDWGQRVLDLVRNAGGDIGPGRLALRRQQLGNVVEGDVIVADAAFILLGGEALQVSAGAVVVSVLKMELRVPVSAQGR